MRRIWEPSPGTSKFMNCPGSMLRTTSDAKTMRQTPSATCVLEMTVKSCWVKEDCLIALPALVGTSQSYRIVLPFAQRRGRINDNYLSLTYSNQKSWM